MDGGLQTATGSAGVRTVGLWRRGLVQVRRNQDMTSLDAIERRLRYVETMVEAVESNYGDEVDSQALLKALGILEAVFHDLDEVQEESASDDG